MAEFLLRVHDKTNTDSVYADVGCLKRGDVVVTCPDGWGWSEPERTNPDWRIVAVPGMSMSEAEAFLAGEPGDRTLNRMLRRRAFFVAVDTASLPNAIKQWLADDTRAEPVLVVPATRVRGLKTLKDPLVDPAVIG